MTLVLSAREKDLRAHGSGSAIIRSSNISDDLAATSAACCRSFVLIARTDKNIRNVSEGGRRTSCLCAPHAALGGIDVLIDVDATEHRRDGIKENSMPPPLFP